jgi:hypothetical protein
MGVSKNCSAAEAGDRYVLVVFEKPCIHCPAKQTTVELVVTGAARATKRNVNRGSNVEIIGQSSEGREIDTTEERERRRRELTSACAALGEEDG